MICFWRTIDFILYYCKKIFIKTWWTLSICHKEIKVKSFKPNVRQSCHKVLYRIIGHFIDMQQLTEIGK